jgi:hypothetical protein
MAFTKSKPTHVLAFSAKKANGEWGKGPTLNLFAGTGKVIYKGSTGKPEYLKKLKAFIDAVDAKDLSLSVSVFKSTFDGSDKKETKKDDFDL